MPFTFETFIDRRAPEPIRVWHPVGDPNDWIALRNHYNDRRHKGEVVEPTTTYRDIHEPMYATVGPDTFQMMLHKYALGIGIMECSGQFIGINEPGANNRLWVPIDTDDIVVHCYTQVPWEHQTCDTYAIRGLIKGRTRQQILNAVQKEVKIAPWLMEYRDDFPEYEVTVSVPIAQTLRYDYLRKTHCRA